MNFGSHCILSLAEMGYVLGGGTGTNNAPVRHFEMEGDIDPSGRLMEEAAKILYSLWLISNSWIPAQKTG